MKSRDTMITKKVKDAGLEGTNVKAQVGKVRMKRTTLGRLGRMGK